MIETIRPQKITTILIGANISVFLLMFILNLIIKSPNPNVDMYQYIMISFSMFKGSGMYSMITSAFVHGGIMHLAMNMFGLYIFGNLVEYNIKFKDFLKLYFVSLFVSSMFVFIYLILFGSNITFVVGASGAIMGVWAFYSLLTHSFKEFVLYFIIYHVVVLLLNMPIAWYSHLGGVVAGILFWFLYYNKKRRIGGFVIWK